MPKRFLVIQTAFLGDAVLATALLEKLHAFYPDAVIDLVVRNGNDGLFAAHPFLRKSFVWDKRSNKTRNLFKLIGELRKERYDHVINCQRFFSTGLMTLLARGDEKIGYDKNPLSFLFSRKVKHVIGDPSAPLGAPPHEVDRLNALIEDLTDKSRPLPKLYPSAKDDAPVKRAKPYVCVAPTSVWFTKQWPAEKWIELVALIPEELEVLLIGAPGDREQCERIASGCRSALAARTTGVRGFDALEDRIHVLAGSTSLLATAALMRGARMNYVNDSAPLHIASAMNAPVTAVFCSTVPAFGFGPLLENGRIVGTSEKLDCRPCGLHGYKTCPKGHFKCALTIATSSVLA